MKDNIKLKYIFPILIFLLAAAYGPTYATPQEQKETSSIFDSKWIRPANGCLYLLLFWMQAQGQVKENFTRQLHPVSLCINVLSQYTKTLLSTLSHEAGHSLMHRYVTGKSNSIHIGHSHYDKRRDPWLTIGNVHFEGIDPLAGHTHIQFPVSEDDRDKLRTFIQNYCTQNALDQTNLNHETLEAIAASPEFKEMQKMLDINHKHYAAILLAGGLAGILGNHVIKMLAQGKQEALKPDAITLYNVFNMLIPLSENSDAALLYKECLGASPEVIDNCTLLGQTLLMLITLWHDLHQSYYDNQTTPDATTVDRLCIGMANYFLMGYARFHA